MKALLREPKAPFIQLNFQLIGQGNDVRLVFSPMWCGPGNPHAWQFYRQVWATAETPKEDYNANLVHEQPYVYYF